MKLLSQLRTSSFQLALLYMVVFATSVFLLLAFIYWRTAGFMTAQTDETIEAEIAGLAEQYRGSGINGLISIIRERVARDPNAKSIYLLTTDAAEYFKRLGFFAITRDAAPDSIRRTREFSHLCPDNATLLCRRL